MFHNAARNFLAYLYGSILVVVIAIVLLANTLAACKKDRTRVYSEAATDGKSMVHGCVWFDGGKGSDMLALCDDGRACVKDDGGNWNCIQFVKPATIERCPENDSGPAPFDAEPGTPSTRGR